MFPLLERCAETWDRYRETLPHQPFLNLAGGCHGKRVGEDERLWDLIVRKDCAAEGLEFLQRGKHAWVVSQPEAQPEGSIIKGAF